MKKITTILFFIITILISTGIVCSAEVPFDPATFYKNDDFEYYAGWTTFPEKMNHTGRDPMYISLITGGNIPPVRVEGPDGNDTIACQINKGTSNMYLNPHADHPINSNIVVFDTTFKVTDITATSGNVCWRIKYEGGEQELLQIKSREVSLGVGAEGQEDVKTKKPQLVFFYQGGNTGDGQGLSYDIEADTWYNVKIVMDSTNPNQLVCSGVYINDEIVLGTKNKLIYRTKGHLTTTSELRIFGNGPSWITHLDHVRIYSPIYKKYVVNSVECGTDSEVKDGTVITGVNLTQYRTDGKNDSLYFALYNELGDICDVRSIKNIQNSFSSETVTLSFSTPITVDGTKGKSFTTKTFIWEDNQFPVINTFNFEKNNPTIYLAGDSTCQNVSEDRLPYAGWGMYLGEYFKDEVEVRNHALGGYGIKHFITEGHLGKILDSYAKRGDYLFIQFGINDSNSGSSRFLQPYQYTNRIKEAINAAKDKDVIPVLVTSTIMYGENTNYDDSVVKPYRERAIQAAKDNGVPYIDITQESIDLVNEWDKYPDGNGSATGGGKQLYWWTPNKLVSDRGGFDKVHLNIYGADEVAKIIINKIKESEDPALKNLATFIDSTKDITQGVPLEVYPW